MEAGDSIKIYCRVRPTAQPSGFLSLAGKKEGEDCTSLLKFDVPPRATTHHGFEHAGVNNSRVQHNFRFDGIFDVDATQEQVFDTVGRPLVLSTLEGFNATAFAYGQTGSGKTFTTTGGAERYEDRGLIPRAVAMLFAECARRTDFVYTVHCSYLEIYNEHGYDLLDGRSAGGGADGESRSGTKHGIEGLHKLRYVHDEDGSGGYVHGLSVHHAANAEAALDLLFIGDTKRAVSSTAMNSVSSRSHAIFTLEIEARRADSDVVRRSKLHIVDLAGSERVGKTGVAALRQVTEAQYINKSLHYLEMVIVALQERHAGRSKSKSKSGTKAGRAHIPYRNSMMTSVLRDSLGGNCRTAMVATINGRAVHTDESISTCRFAQRVAQVKNVAKMNESIDPQLLIQRLKEENQRLRDGGQVEDENMQRNHALSAEEEEALRAEVLRFVSHPGAEAPKIDLTLGHGTLGRKGGAWFRARRAMCMLRDVARRARGIGAETRPAAGAQEGTAEATTCPGNNEEAAAQHVHETAETLRRQTEIACRQALALLVWKRNQVTDKTSPSAEHLHVHPLADTKQAWTDFNAANDALSRVPSKLSQMVGTASASQRLISDRCILMDRQRQREKQEKLTAEARSCATKINCARSRIVQLKSDLERERVRQAMTMLSVDEDADDSNPSAAAAASSQEASIVSSIECTKAKYQDGCARLRSIKAEIEALRRASQRNTKRLVAQRRADFALWLDVMRDFGLAPQDEDGLSDGKESSDSGAAATDRECTKAEIAKENIAQAPGCSEKPAVSDAISSSIAELRSALRQQYALAKDTATEVSNSRNEIKRLKSRQEALRVSDHDEAASMLQPELDRQKQLYREGFAELKALKRTISSLQQQLEQDASGRAKGVLEQRRQALMCNSAGASGGHVCHHDDSRMRQDHQEGVHHGTKYAWE